MHSARIVSSVSYLAEDGQRCAIPKGPCLIEKLEGPRVEVVWGAKGQNCTTLALDDVENAEAGGNLVLLD